MDTDNTSYIPKDIPSSAEEPKGASQLGDIIGKLTADPELMGRIFSVLGREKSISQKAEESTPTTKTSSVSSVTAPPSHSDITSKLPEIMATLAPMLSGEGEASKVLEAVKKIEKHDDRRSCLLRAIKPYVSRGRGEAIDYMIRIAGITEILKQIN